MSSSLIGVVDVKLLRSGSYLFVSLAQVIRLSSRSARGRRMMGSGRTRRVNLFHDLAGSWPRGMDSQRVRLAHPPHGNDPVQGGPLFRRQATRSNAIASIFGLLYDEGGIEFIETVTN